MKFFVIVFGLIAVAASASLKTSALSNEQKIIQQVITAINSPSTDPNTVVALKALLQNLLGASIIQQPVIVQPAHPIAVGPAFVDTGYEPIAVGPVLVEAGLEPIALGPALVEAGYEPIDVGPVLVDIEAGDSNNLENDAASGVSGLINIIQNIFQVNIVQTVIYNRGSNSAADAATAVDTTVPEISPPVLPEAVGVAMLPEAVGVAVPVDPVVVALPDILN